MLQFVPTNRKLCYILLEFENMLVAAYSYDRLNNPRIHVEELHNTCLCKRMTIGTSVAEF